MTATVTVTYDAAADAAYIYLRPPGPGDRVRTALICEQGQGNPMMVFVDVDFATGRLAGIEALGAWEGLPVELLAGAARIDEQAVGIRFLERMRWRGTVG